MYLFAWWKEMWETTLNTNYLESYSLELWGDFTHSSLKFCQRLYVLYALYSHQHLKQCAVLFWQSFRHLFSYRSLFKMLKVCVLVVDCFNNPAYWPHSLHLLQSQYHNEIVCCNNYFDFYKRSLCFAWLNC